MAVNSKKDFGSPIGILIGLVVFLVGVYFQPSKANFLDKKIFLIIIFNIKFINFTFSFY